MNADSPSGIALKRNETFHRSLASRMTQFQMLEFDKVDKSTCDDAGEEIVSHS